ncbi:MAG: hypothetical protein ACXADY_17795 [Candidatus Hodarchaeales archaeon]
MQQQTTRCETCGKLTTRERKYRDGTYYYCSWNCEFIDHWGMYLGLGIILVIGGLLIQSINTRYIAFAIFSLGITGMGLVLIGGSIIGLIQSPGEEMKEKY